MKKTSQLPVSPLKKIAMIAVRCREELYFEFDYGDGTIKTKVHDDQQRGGEEEDIDVNGFESAQLGVE